ncbi:DUF4837 family protein [Pseudofulvibacter geojedonensis]|uniref:DUF4837 family protein n=1 Tax=Pseudofulvibacter geojedonensis TaxID=1123758 RepID=A0ABW3I4B8_9FLAO
MKKLFSILFVVIAIAACNDKKNEKKGKSLPASGGTLNKLTIVTTNNLWNGSVGDTTRDIFAGVVYGLPQEEPRFDLTQMLPKAFHEFVKKTRTFVEIKEGEEKGVKYVTDVYASPQTGIIITGKNKEEIVAVLKENATEMLAKLKQTELDYKVAQMNKNPFDKGNVINDAFGIDLSVLFSYRVAKNKDNFMWLRKDIKNGDMNLMIYELPKNYIKNDSLAITNIVKMRDSIGKAHIPGPIDGSYMITEKAFTPIMQPTTVAGMSALETRGTWDVKNDFMAGPYVNYIINDDKNNRQLVIEGFTYAPQINKRDFMFELEAMVRSLKLN